MNEESMRGLIFDIQQFAVHDGPGCRTMVFMKGCPLACAWCANPEGRRERPEIMYSRRACVHDTYECVTACPWGAITVPKQGDFVQIARDNCIVCNQYSCVEACPNEAIRIVGRYITVQELMIDISRDRAYWGSGGGLTITGGEPLIQPGFVTEVLKRSFESGINTLLETCAFVPWSTLQRTLDYLDWVMVDIKHMNPARHREATGTDNRLILDNIERTAKADGPRLFVRVPVIPGFNDSESNMSETAEFLRRIESEEVNLLPFHRLAISKYEQIGLEYEYKDVIPPKIEQMQRFKEIFERQGIRCYLGDDTPF
jgi:pyruvate formate lyase activating enzyme